VVGEEGLNVVLGVGKSSDSLRARMAHVGTFSAWSLTISDSTCTHLVQPSWLGLLRWVLFFEVVPNSITFMTLIDIMN
jgi:hypothetical protein